MDGVFASIDDPRLSQLYLYWQSRKRGKPMPAPENIDLAGLPSSVQPNLMLLEVVRDAARTRFRYTKVGKVFWRAGGSEPIGKFVDDVLPMTAGYRDYVVGIYEEMAACGRPMYTENLFILQHGHSDPMATKRVSLPLSRDGARVDQVLAGHVFDYGAGGGDSFALVTGLSEVARAFLE
jgi:hypothetical protein